MAADWLTRLGKRGFEALVDDVVRNSVEKSIQTRVEPRFSGLEDRMTGVENRLAGVENRLAGIESRLDVADRLAKLETEVGLLKSK
jgi:hypothetical protein